MQVVSARMCKGLSQPRANARGLCKSPTAALTNAPGTVQNKKSPCPKCPKNNCRDCPTKSRRVASSQQKSDDNQNRGELSLQSSTLASTVALSTTLGAVNPFKDFLQGQADFFSTLNLPDWLVHWGHPGNMAVVLFAMGGYGALYLGWQIRLTDDIKLKQKAMDLHPKLAGGMAVFFALGSMGGMMSLLMQHQDPFQSSHFVTGMLGLSALAFQAMLPLFFNDDPQARNMHAFLGTGVMALFFIHAALGLQLGLSI